MCLNFWVPMGIGTYWMKLWTIPCEMWKNLEAFLGEFIYSIQFINLYPHLFWVFVFMPTFCNFSHRQCISLSHASLSFLYSSSHLWRDHTFLSLLELVPLRMRNCNHIIGHMLVDPSIWKLYDMSIMANMWFFFGFLLPQLLRSWYKLHISFFATNISVLCGHHIWATFIINIVCRSIPFEDVKWMIKDI